MDYLSNAYILANRLNEELKNCREDDIKHQVNRNLSRLVIKTIIGTILLETIYLILVDRPTESMYKLVSYFLMVLIICIVYVVYTEKTMENTIPIKLGLMGCVPVATKDMENIMDKADKAVGKELVIKDYIFLDEEKAKMAIDISNRVEEATPLELQFLLMVNIHMSKYSNIVKVTRDNKREYESSCKAIKLTYESLTGGVYSGLDKDNTPINTSF